MIDPSRLIACLHTTTQRYVIARRVGLAAYREIADAAKGLEIAHLQFAFFELTLADGSRVRRDGIVEVEIGLGDPRVLARSFTAAQVRQAIAAARARTEGSRASRSAHTR